MERKETVQRIREFNRFYMPLLRLLDNHYLGSAYTPTEARVLYEIYECHGCNAAHIAKEMNIDKSYLSRIIRSHEKNGFIIREISSEDSRAYHLYLTEAGVRLTEDFIQKSNEEVEEMIYTLPRENCLELIHALDTVTDILKTAKKDKTQGWNK